MGKNKKVNYPLKYAVMQIEGQTGWSIGLHQLEREYNTIVNIACKCYVISEKKQYSNDGSFNIEYEVVFLYEESEFRDEEFELATPRFNIYSQCINSTLVNQLFDTFEEAQSLAKEYNNELLKRKIGHLAYKKDLENNIKSLKLEHQETLDIYNQIEQHLEQKTMNMSVQKTTNIEELIEKVTKNSSEFYTKLASALSVEEQQFLQNSVENRNCSNCLNDHCKLESFEKIGLDELKNPQGSDCLGWSNPELVGRQLILKKFYN